MSLVGCIITKLRHEVIPKQQYMFNGHEMNSESVYAMRNETFLSRCLRPRLALSTSGDQGRRCTS